MMTDQAEPFGVKMKKQMPLPENMLIEVLVYLPVKSLIRFRRLSKYWCSLIESPIFVVRHLKCDRNRSILIKRHLPPPNYKEIHKSGENIFSFHSPDFPNFLVSPTLFIPFLNDIDAPEYLELFGPCNGLVCLVFGETIILCNPALQEFQLLVPSPFANPDGYVDRYVGSGFGFDANTNGYKFVHMCKIVENLANFAEEDESYYYREEDSHMRVELYNLSTNSWSLLDPILPDVMYNPGFDLFFKGACHWQARAFMPGSSSLAVILSFDVNTEIFRQFEFPHWFEDGKRPSLMALNQCLALVRYRDWMNEGPDLLDVWVMKEYGVKESWTKEFSMGPYQFRRVFFHMENESLLVETNDGQLASCALHENKIERYQFRGLEDSFRAVIFVESLLSLNQVLQETL